MSKFNVGDRVRINRVELEEQSQFIGEVHEVYDTEDEGIRLCDMGDNDDYWLDEEVELVRPNLYGEHVFNYIDDTMDTSKRDIDSIDALRYCINDLITTNNCCEKIEEEKDMNKVVNLWYERKRDKIVDKYKEMEAEFYNNKYSVVESFNELVDKFNEDLESLYKMDKATEQFVLKENAPTNVVKYCLDLDKLKEEFEVEYLIKRNEELKEIEDTRLEVEAQLSLSNDLEYQQEVLERYGIINKKTKKIVG